jgi:hypothetical protein
VQRILHVVNNNNGGGGDGGSLSRDHCPNGDFSPSYYDGSCGDTSETTKSEHNAPDDKPQDATLNPDTGFGEEILTAYKWAYKYNITTQPTVQEADPDGFLIRPHFAKMIVNYMANVLNKKPDTTKDCSAFAASIQSETEELQTYMTLACQYGVMGIHTDGSALSDFMPNRIISRAEFGTVLSRILWGDTYNDSIPYYERHLQALKSE